MKILQPGCKLFFKNSLFCYGCSHCLKGTENKFPSYFSVTFRTEGRIAGWMWYGYSGDDSVCSYSQHNWDYRCDLNYRDTCHSFDLTGHRCAASSARSSSGCEYDRIYPCFFKFFAYLLPKSFSVCNGSSCSGSRVEYWVDFFENTL